MAIMGETAVASTELETVRKDLPTLFDRTDTFYSTIDKKDVEKVSNIAMRVPIEIRPGGKPGHFNPEDGSLGLGAGPTFDKATVTVQHLKYGVQWTKKAEWATDDARKAVVNTARYLVAKAMAEFRRFLDTLCIGSAGNGVIGTVSSASWSGGVDTVVLGTDGFGAKLLRFAQDIGIMDATLATNRTAGTDKEITYLDPPTKTIKYAQATAVLAVAGDKIVVGGLGNVTGTNVVSINGIPYHHSAATTGTWQGMDRALIPEIRGNAVNANSGQLSLSFVRRALNQIGDRVGYENMKKVVAWMHPCQKQAYEELGQQVSIINKTAKEEGLDLFFGDSMQMAGAPVKTHFGWDKTRIDFVASEVWGRAEMHPADFYEVDGKKFFENRDTSTGAVKTSQMFYLTISMQPFVTNPALTSFIYALKVPTGY